MKIRVLDICFLWGLLFNTSVVECFANRQANIQKDVDFEQMEKIPLRWFRRITRKSTNVEKFIKFRKARIVRKMAPIMGKERSQVINAYIIE